MEFNTTTERDGIIGALQYTLVVGLAICGIGYAGSLWALSREQAAELAVFRAQPAQKIIDCTAAELVATCASADPFATCTATAAEAGK